MIRKFFDPTKSFLFILIVLAVSGAGGSFYFHAKYRAIKADPYLEVKKETAAVVLSVGALMELPKGETPTIATVSDKEKLRGQSFFQAAENGDILLVYGSAMKAVLYRPAANKIINAGPVSPGLSGGSAPAIAPEETASSTNNAEE